MAKPQPQPPKPPPEQQAQAAKEALLGSASEPGQIQLFIQRHTWESLGLAALAGFLITALKPGRTMLRQTVMLGLSMGAKRMLLKYFSPDS